MLAWDSTVEKIKHYRVDKMYGVSMTNDKREGTEAFEKTDMSAYTKSVFGMFGGKEEKVRLRFTNRLAGVVIDRFGTDVMIHPHDEEHFHAGMTVTVSPQFFGWLAGIGKGIRISWPEDVREAYKQYLQGIIDNT
jgi:predicted DNA-binding transcriptional regulator YafY